MEKGYGVLGGFDRLAARSLSSLPWDGVWRFEVLDWYGAVLRIEKKTIFEKVQVRVSQKQLFMQQFKSSLSTCMFRRSLAPE